MPVGCFHNFNLVLIEVVLGSLSLSHHVFLCLHHAKSLLLHLIERFIACMIVGWFLNVLLELQVLGSGFEVISVGKRKLVRSVPTELNKDHNEILELAQVTTVSYFIFSNSCIRIIFVNFYVFLFSWVILLLCVFFLGASLEYVKK